MLYPGYCDSLEDCYRRHSSPEYDFFIKHQDAIGLCRAERILSLGAGFGRSEEILKRTGLLTNLVEYHALEPEKTVHQKLCSKLPVIFPDVKLVLSDVKADDYDGAEDMFDIIFAMKMIHYVEDKIGLIKRALRWLKPGGKLLIEQLEGQSSFIKYAARGEDNRRLYQASDVTADLNHLGLSFKEFLLEYDNDVRNVTQLMANFYALKEANEEEVADVKAFLEKTVPSGIERHTFVMFVIEKPNI